MWGTFVAALAVVAAHLLSISRPPELSFPTARFVPERTVPAVSRASRPTDVWLMMLRVLAVVCAGVAFAGVTVAPSRESVVTLVAVDARVAADTAALRRALGDVTREAQRDNMQVVGIVSAFGVTPVDRVWDAESVATSPISVLLGADASDSIVPLDHQDESVATSTLLLRARRAVPDFASAADSVRLLVLAPSFGALRDVPDDALPAVRAVWPGRVELRSVAVSSTSAALRPARDAVTIRGANDDEVRAAFARWGDLPAVTTRVVRDSLKISDSLAAQNGEAVVVWVAGNAPKMTSTNTDAEAIDASAVVANGVALVAPLRRVRELSADSALRAIAWWNDGAPAAVEKRVGAGCIRVVGFAPPAGDALLTVPARGVLAALVAECGAGASSVVTSGAVSDAASVDASGAASGASSVQDSMTRLHMDSLLVGTGGYAASRELRASLPAALSPLTRWLLLAAVALVVAEMVLARARAGARP
jgi:hypothetical protein